MKNSETSALKLNYRRTALIGFAFFGILLLWQVYDSWCPTFLTDIFARSIYDLSSAELKASAPEKLLHVQWIVGIIMACDNLAALILLPIFGNLSDRTRTPIGKRMPYILVGTFVSALAFPFIPLFFHRNNILGMVAMMAVVLLFMMMYRNPAVALMPDITPKPLRAKANGIINIMGYFGGAFATVLGILFVLSSYINAPVAERNLWTIELPFIIASVLMVISALVLFAAIKENRVEAEIRDDLALGERLAAVETPIDTVVSHTAPSFCELNSHRGLQSWAAKDPELLADVNAERATMDQVFKCLRQKKHPIERWLYGHFHQSWTGLREGILFSMLDIEEFKEIPSAGEFK